MKMSKLITVPREKKEDAATDQAKQANSIDDGESSGQPKADSDPEDVKPDFMIPLSFQSDMGHIHQKAGFTVVGE